MNDSDLLRILEHLRDLMMSVSTGGPRIETVNADYKTQYALADRELRQRGLSNTVPFSDLWDWHGRWSSGDLPSYRSRRTFLADLFDPMVRQVRDRIAGVAPRVVEPTGWPK